MKIFVAHASNFDFKEKLYKPLRESPLNTLHEIHLPQEGEKEEITKDLIKNCDVVIAEVSLPSTGQGVELGWANIFEVPIICIHEKDSKPSGALQFISNTFIEYENSIDMMDRLTNVLKGL